MFEISGHPNHIEIIERFQQVYTCQSLEKSKLIETIFIHHWECPKVLFGFLPILIFFSYLATLKPKVCIVVNFQGLLSTKSSRKQFSLKNIKLEEQLLLKPFLVLVFYIKVYLVKMCLIFDGSSLAFGASYQSFLRVY